MFTGLLIALLVMVTVAGGVAWRRRQNQLSSAEPRPLLPSAGGGGGDALLARTIRDLRPGDVLTWDGRDLVVEGVIRYEEEGHRWAAGRANDGAEERWVMVGLERGASFTVRMLQVDTELDMEGLPPEVLVTGDARYQLDKRGTATAQVSGQTGLNLRANAEMGTVERCRWWLYDSPGDDTAVVEQWSGTYRVLRGREIRPEMIDFMPGS